MQGAVDLTGYHLSFDAEMTSASDMGYFINHFNNGDTTIAGNGELENYVPYTTGGSTYTFQNGELTIAATPTPSNGLPYTSGMLSTGYSFYQNTGYFEVRAQVPSTAGFWPAFWALGGGPTDYSSELDILEQPNNDGNSNYFTSIKTPQLNEGLFQNTGVDLSAGYHSYGLMWTATSMQFTLDGQYVGQVFATPSALQDLKMYMIANMAVGGGWAGAPAAGSSAQLNIDYIRAYSNDPGVPGWWGGTEAISSPDGVNTTPNLTGASTDTTTMTGVTATATAVTPATTDTTTVTSIGTTTPIILGSSSDTLTISVSEDAYNGDAQYRVLVDGYYVGDTYTATASHAAGLITQQTVTGNWGTGPHAVGIEFINDAYNGSPSTDRNLYVSSINYDGQQVAMNTLAETTNGVATVLVPTTNVLTLNLAEDAYQGDAQVSVMVDGTLVNTSTSVTASHADGATQAFSFTAGLTSGTHDIGVTFLNDLYGGSTSADRNLYVDGATLNGTPLTTSAWTATLGTNSTDHFTLVVPSS